MAKAEDDMLLKDKKVCANCANVYQEIKNLGYDHYEPHRCKENNGKECSDVCNTTCYKFIKKNNPELLEVGYW